MVWTLVCSGRSGYSGHPWGVQILDAWGTLDGGLLWTVPVLWTVGLLWTLALFSIPRGVKNLDDQDLLEQGRVGLAMPYLQRSSAMLSSPLRPLRTIRILSSVE